MIKKITSAIFVALLSLSSAEAQEATAAYKDPTLSVDLRVKDLLSRMTLEEKFWQIYMIPGDLSEGKERFKHGLFGFQTDTKSSSANVAEQILDYNSGGSSAKETAIKINDMQRFFVEETRLGIPIIAWDEALHGLIRSGATCFPVSMGMAASWNEPLMREVSAAIAIETASRGIRDVLSPVVNLATDPRWGRTEESYGEDPHLSSRMGVAFVSEFEKRGVITTPKHYITNHADGGRDSYPVNFSEHHIRETYLLPFEACFTEGGSRSVMSAYNSIDGISCTASSVWLKDVLKGDLSFDGFVVSDAGATGGANVLHFTSGSYPESTKHAIEGGLDVLLQSSYHHYPLFYEAFEKGMIDPEAIDGAVARILKAKFELGLFENPYVDIEKVESSNHNDEHIETAYRMATESFVLLKNDNNTLPLKGQKSIALIGYDIAEARVGGYSGTAEARVSILDGFKERLGSSVKINYAAGVELAHSDFVTVPSSSLSTGGSEGLSAKYYSNAEFAGTPTLERIDKQLSFGWTLYSPEDGVIPYDCYSVVWEGKICSPESGEFNIGLNGNDGYRLYIDGKLIVDNFKKVSFNSMLAPFNFVKGREYDIRVEYYESVGNVRLSLVWDLGVDKGKWQREIKEARAAAMKSDLAVVTLGIREGEGGDRALLSAQGKQLEMLDAVIATGKPVVVLIVGGSAMTMDGWRDRVSAIMDIWYPGEQGGYAVADVMMGKHSPSGRLPITFPISEAQLPLTYNHKPTGRIDDYNNMSGQPLFPFGYGLSYTTFEYSDMQISKKEIGRNESVKVSCKVTNSGAYDSKEVVQLYIRDVISSISQPLIALKHFEKISLKAGESKVVEFTIEPKDLKLLNRHMEWVVEPGDFRIMIGCSSKDIRLRDYLTVE